MSFAELKRKRTSLSEMRQKLEEAKGNNYNDERMWKLSIDSNKKGSAIIRFMPPSHGNENPYVLRYAHGFKGASGKWFIENCPSTIGEKCPCCKHGSKLYSDGMKEQARPFFRSKSYYFNVYIVKDSAHPENEGKVFIFRCGQKIFDMILGAMAPEFDDIEAINVFDLWEGANFNLRSTMGDGGFASYASSSFSSPTQLKDTDEELEAIYNKC